MAMGNHDEGFEKEKKFMEIHDKVRKINPSLYQMRNFKEIVSLINPVMLEGLFEIRSCNRRLLYIAFHDWQEAQETEKKDQEHDYFVCGGIYYSTDFNGATYSFDGYVDDKGIPKRIGCAYFEWLKDDGKGSDNFPFSAVPLLPLQQVLR